MMKKITLFIAMFLLCFTVSAQQLTVQLVAGGTGYNQAGAASLQAAINSIGVPLGDITQLLISSGDFTTADWEYLRNNTSNLSNLSAFGIDAAVNSVADIPNTTSGSSYFNPSSIQFLSLSKVTSIGESAFENCSSLSSTDLPQVTSLGNSAFKNCSALSSMDFPQVTSIGNSTFNGCSSLSALQLGVTPPTTVGSDAFAGTADPRNLVFIDAMGTPLAAGSDYDAAIAAYDAAGIPDNDGLWYGWTIALPLEININNLPSSYTGTSLEDAISNSSIVLSTITHLEVTAGDFTTADWEYLKNNNGSTGLTALTNFTIADGVTSVANMPSATFMNNTVITTVSIAKVTSTGAATFLNGSALTTVSFPQATSIDDVVFRACGNLTTANIPLATSIGYAAFEECRDLTEVNFPLVTSIDGSAFGFCDVLAEANFPLVTSIGANAFQFSVGLTTASFPQATSIGNGAFKSCSALATLQLGATPPTIGGTDAFTDTPTTRNIVIVDAMGDPLMPGSDYDTAKAAYDPDGDGKWYGWTIADAPALRIQVNGGAPQIGTSLENAIANAGVALGSITQLEITAGDFTTADWVYLRDNRNNLNALAIFTITDDINTVADIPNTSSSIPYFNASSITTVSVAKVTSIGVRAFQNCNSLTTVSFPQATLIGSAAFYQCGNLTSVSFPQATSIGGTAFYQCGNLTSVSFPQVISIGLGTFYGCNTLTTASFPLVTSIGQEAFSVCSDLSTLQLGATPPYVETNAFNGTPDPRNLVIVNGMSNPLTVGTAYDTAKAAYDAAGTPDGDGKWYGWTIADAVSCMTLSLAQTNISTTGGNDGSLTVTATEGTEPYTYTWNNGATTQTISGLTAGTYTVTVTDAAACVTMASATITEPIPLQFTTQPSTSTQSVTQNGTTTALSVAVTGGESPYSYQWYRNTTASNTGGTAITGATSAIYTPSTATAGTTYYYAVVTDSDNISITSDVSGAVTVTAVAYAKALDFDGTDDRVSIPSNSDNDITGTQITLEAKIKVDQFRPNAYQGGIIVKEGAQTGYMIRAGGSNGVVNFNLGSGSWNEVNSGANTLTTGQWYHIAATYDGTTQKLYVDGQLVASQGVSISIASTSNALGIGNWTAGGPDRGFNGIIDEVRIWDVARTQAQINAFKDNELPASEQNANLKVYYQLNQGIANANNSSENMVYNEKLGTNEGSLQNFDLTGATSNWVDDTSVAAPPLLVFVTQPSADGQTVLQNAPATTLMVEVEAYGSTPSYQWYSNTTASNTGGTAIAGATSASYTPSTATLGTTYYYVVASVGSNSLTSDVSGAITVSVPQIYYVTQTGAGNMDGSSWANASNDIQAMINTALNSEKIFVAGGTYKPNRPAYNLTSIDANNRDNAFVLKDGVKLYGGFAGTEAEEGDRTDIDGAHKTTLSGDIGTAGDNTDNAYHVVLSISDTDATVLDGFTIANGNANEGNFITVETESVYRSTGGGMYNHNSSPSITNVTFNGNTANKGGGMFNYYSSPSITNVTFSGNMANYRGGGMYNYYSSPSITNVTFSGNMANSRGGGMHNNSSSPTMTNVEFNGNTSSNDGGGMSNSHTSSPSMTNVKFSGNTASDNGGGMYNSNTSSPSIANVTFSGNVASSSGGGMYTSFSLSMTDVTFSENTANDGGGMYTSSSLSMTNVTFSGNTANNGGGMYIEFSSSPSMTNVTFSGNTANTSGGGMYNDDSSPSIYNSIFWGNKKGTATDVAGADIENDGGSPTVEYCLTQENSTYSSGTGIINNQDPLFVDASNPAGADGIFGTADDGLRLQCASPAINAGNNNPQNVNMPSTDITGAARIQGSTVDMGAYEGGESTSPVSAIANTSLPTEEGVYVSDYAFEEGGMIHYCTCDNKLLLSLGTNSNVPDDGVSLKIGATQVTHYAQGVGFINNPNGASLMNRTWNAAPTTQPSGEVVVRYYYTAADYAAINTSLTDNGGTALTGVEQMQFYKVTKPGAHLPVADIATNEVIVLNHGTTPSTTVWQSGSIGSNHYAEFSVSSFSGGGGGASSAGQSLLPVEMIYIRATKDGEDVRLDWATASEVNNSGFEVERSIDGRRFETIGYVQGSGTTTEEMVYDYMDTDANPGINYYRLKQMDYDGGYEYSNIVAVRLDGKSGYSVYPNPTINVLYINQETDYSIINSQGQLVKKGTGDRIDVSNLQPGLYQIRLGNGNIERFIKM